MDKIKEYFFTIFKSIPFFWWIFGSIVFSILSFHIHYIDQLQIPVFALFSILFFVLSLYRLHYGILILFTELLLGSKGYLYSIELFSTTISLRLAWFVLLFIATLFWIIRERKISFLHWSLFTPYLMVCVTIFIGVVVGLLQGNALSTIFFDANGYLYVLLFIPLTQAIKTRKEIDQLLAVFYASLVTIAIQTFFFLLLFSHKEIAPYTIVGLYLWIRQAGIGEVTTFPNGFPRIFLQSQIFLLIGFFLIAPWFAYITRVKEMAAQKIVRKIYLLIILCVAVVIVSYSRSFWAASIATFSLFALFLLFYAKMPLKHFFFLSLFFSTTVIASYAFIFATINVPLPGHSAIGNLLSQRTQNVTSEPAAASRWNLVTPLVNASLEHPLLGSGLGKTITYISQDPRVLESSPDGTYTTYAFEWGYLDFLLKFGLLGIFTFSFLFFSIIKKMYQRIQQRGTMESVENIGILFGLIALAATHMFTPYLNHPLGIGCVLLFSVIASLPKTTKSV